MYRPVPRVPDFPAMERDILRFWEEHRIFEKLRAKNANGPRWSFLDGPITANNPMGVHHAWGRSLKDMYQRYHAMNGQALRYQNGFDCQGLWVEVEVEKSLGLRTKREIRDFGIEKFRARLQGARAHFRRASDRAIHPAGLLVRLGRSQSAARAARRAGGWRPGRDRDAAQRAHRDRASQRDRPQTRLGRIRRQLLHLLRRKQLHHLGDS